MKSGLEIAVRYSEQGIAWSPVQGDMMTKNDTTYVLTGNSSAVTDVELTLETEMKMKVPDFMVNKVITKGVDDTLKAIKQRAESS